MFCSHWRRVVISAVCLLAVMLGGCRTVPKEGGAAWRAPLKNWDALSNWNPLTDGKNALNLSANPEGGIQAAYEVKGGWVAFGHTVSASPPDGTPITFMIKATGGAELEVKWIDRNDSNFGRRLSLKQYPVWTPVVIYPSNLEYWWGGDEKDDGLKEIQFAISGNGNGNVWLKHIGYGSPDLEASFPRAGPLIDPDAKLEGIGFEQRRAAKMIPEDPLVLEWLKQVQDTASPDQIFVPSQEDTDLNLFNQTLIAMAFIVKGERERAERILDFMARATVRDNTNPRLQNFFYQGEARGFFQNFNNVRVGDQPPFHRLGNSDRWMGDMAWLLIACKYYEKTYDSDRYAELTKLLKDLLISWFKEEGDGGYVQHGWREGDKRLHENHGHPEGNIDCYAAFKLCGEDVYAEKIRRWLNTQLTGKKLPLDLYTWRVLAYGPEAAEVLDIPEHDLRYRKTVEVDGDRVAGFYHGADADVNNIWLDGTGHIACAYITCGDRQRGFFYANQLDAFLIDREIGGVKTRGLPYTANKEGGYEWVKLDRGFASVAAWYIFAKNRFNPMKLEKN